MLIRGNYKNIDVQYMMCVWSSFVFSFGLMDRNYDCIVCFSVPQDSTPTYFLTFVLVVSTQAILRRTSIRGLAAIDENQLYVRSEIMCIYTPSGVNSFH